MPVIDHPVHERTRVGDDFRYGCHNRGEYKSGYWAPQRVFGFDDRFTVELTWVPYRMSRQCMTAETGQALTDPNCRGCKRINPASSPAPTPSDCSSASGTEEIGGR